MEHAIAFRFSGPYVQPIDTNKTYFFRQATIFLLDGNICMCVHMYFNLRILLYTVLPPSAPTNVMGSPTATSVILTWSQSSMDVVTGYTVSYTRTGGCSDAPLSSTGTASVSPYALSNLEENTPYQINIVARNSGSMSSPAVYPTTTLSSGEFTSYV